MCQLTSNVRDFLDFAMLKKCSVDFSALAPLSIAQGTYCLAQNYLKGDLTRTLNQKLKYT